MKPLRVDFHFAAPIVIPANPIHLDALLAAMRVERAIQGRMENPYDTQEDLPLEFEEKNGIRVWKASAIDINIEGGIRGQCMMRLTDVESMARDKAAGFLRFNKKFVNTNAGPDKNYVMYYRIGHVSTASAWCVGDMDGVRDLLKGLRHVGRMGRNGHGELDRRIVNGIDVPAIDVTEDRSAKTRWSQRIMPWPLAGYEPIVAAYRAPYWEPKNKRTCFIPPSIVR